MADIHHLPINGQTGVRLVNFWKVLTSDVNCNIVMIYMALSSDVVVAGFTSGTGASRRLLMAVLDQELRLLLSTPLLIEYEAVLTRPAVLAMAGVSAKEVAAALDELVILCVPVALDYRWRPQARDPNDDLVLETAINGGADVVASFNVTDMRAGARRFCIPVERPGVVVRRMTG